jgi:hypothetical protein
VDAFKQVGFPRPVKPLKKRALRREADRQRRVTAEIYEVQALKAHVFATIFPDLCL